VIRLALRVRREEAEVALAALLDLAPGGVEEVDLGDRIEYAVYGPPGELPALPDLEAAAGDALVEVVTAEVPDDWAERWRAFHRPVEIGPLRVRPPWEPARGGGVDLVVDPGQAFGTGAHHTTRLCLDLLLRLAPGGALVDVGCGSGVLAIAAARLGWSPVRALDHDPLALEATSANAAANGAEVAVDRFDVRRGTVPGAPTVLANLLRPLLLELRVDPPPEALVISGLLGGEAGEVGRVLGERFGLAATDRVDGGEWAAVLLRRGGG
jgi:ribosomal protein L11 methyltransferase